MKGAEKSRRDAETIGLTIAAAIVAGPIAGACSKAEPGMIAERAFDVAEALFTEAKKRGRDPIALIGEAIE